MVRESKGDVGPALILVVGALVVVPGMFSYYVLANALREQNLCHVGPVSFNINSNNTALLSKFEEQRASLESLYGTYTTFDDASYYFVKTPYQISPQFLPDYGYWSVSTLAVTLLSPYLRRQRQNDWRALEDLDAYEIETTPAIQWDQSHEIQYFLPDEHSSKPNRWCLLNRQNHKTYLHTEEGTRTSEILTSVDSEIGKPDFFQICAAPQASILSSGDQAPYFIELPLHAPLPGIWNKYESDTTREKDEDDDNQGADGSADYRRMKRRTNPYQIQVQCHVRNMDLRHLAHGSLQPDSKPNLGWEHAETIEMPMWNVFYLPGTLSILLGLLSVHLRQRSPASRSRHVLHATRQRTQESREWNLVRAVQLIWFQDSWQQLSLTSFWVYCIGMLLEPLVGTITYLTISGLFLQLIAIISSDSCFLWICFGQSILLAQLQPDLSIGPVDIGAISVGALKLNIISVMLVLIPFVATSSEIPWWTAASCLAVGWTLAMPLTMELFAAPQWTIPTFLLGHLWWQLCIQSDQDAKKTDEEMTSLSNDFESVENDSEYQDDWSTASFNSSVAAIALTKKERSSQFNDMVGYNTFIAAWFALTILCMRSMDWTLVVGNVMTLWLYMGCNQLPDYHLWSLYHMVASSIIIALNIMTLTGWYLCQVAIAVQTLHSWPSTYVYASMALQTMAQCIGLLHTAHSKDWDSIKSLPGYYFWSNVRRVAEEIRLRCRLFC